MLMTSCLANKALIMQQLLHLESPQEMHHFNWGVSFLPRPLSPPPQNDDNDDNEHER